MSWRDAPLYVHAHDLARWVLERTGGWGEPEAAGGPLQLQVAAAACDLLTGASLALTFPATRPRHLEQADEAIVRLRVLLRLARDLGLLSAGGTRYATGRLSEIGRMIGGWRKRVDRSARRVANRSRKEDTRTGDGPPPATTG
jgi:hypothetical protein